MTRAIGEAESHCNLVVPGTLFRRPEDSHIHSRASYFETSSVVTGYHAPDACETALIVCRRTATGRRRSMSPSPSGVSLSNVKLSSSLCVPCCGGLRSGLSSTPGVTCVALCRPRSRLLLRPCSRAKQEVHASRLRCLRLRQRPRALSACRWPVYCLSRVGGTSPAVPCPMPSALRCWR